MIRRGSAGLSFLDDGLRSSLSLTRRMIVARKRYQGVDFRIRRNPVLKSQSGPKFSTIIVAASLAFLGDALQLISIQVLSMMILITVTASTSLNAERCLLMDLLPREDHTLYHQHRLLPGFTCPFGFPLLTSRRHNITFYLACRGNIFLPPQLFPSPKPMNRVLCFALSLLPVCSTVLLAWRIRP